MKTRIIASSLLALTLSIVGQLQSANADEYVWARSNWYSGPNRPVSAMGNGYGGYYVPKNAYGNNYEGQRITNPNGFIVPAQTGQQVQAAPARRLFRRR